MSSWQFFTFFSFPISHVYDGNWYAVFSGYLVLKRTQGDIPFERGPVFRGQVYERVGISLVEVYEKVAKSFITVWKAWKGKHAFYGYEKVEKTLWFCHLFLF